MVFGFAQHASLARLVSGIVIQIGLQCWALAGGTELKPRLYPGAFRVELALKSRLTILTAVGTARVRQLVPNCSGNGEEIVFSRACKGTVTNDQVIAWQRLPHIQHANHLKRMTGQNHLLAYGLRCAKQLFRELTAQHHHVRSVGVFFGAPTLPSQKGHLEHAEEVFSRDDTLGSEDAQVFAIWLHVD